MRLIGNGPRNDAGLSSALQLIYLPAAGAAFPGPSFCSGGSIYHSGPFLCIVLELLASTALTLISREKWSATGLKSAHVCVSGIAISFCFADSHRYVWAPPMFSYALAGCAFCIPIAHDSYRVVFALLFVRWLSWHVFICVRACSSVFLPRQVNTAAHRPSSSSPRSGTASHLVDFG